MPFFAIVMATRNRPALFAQALDSVLAQSCSDTEVIVVNDGSEPEYQVQYENILSAIGSRRVRSFGLISRPKGHGQSYALNFGVTKATTPYLCFLDDDDYWIDSDHLSRAQQVIDASSSTVDLYMTDQDAFLGDEKRPGPIWIEDLPAVLATVNSRPDRYGAHTVPVEQLLRSGGFCHLNTLIIRRELYQEVGGMEESIRWECDHDIYFRLIDHAHTIKYAPITVARHNIPDPATRTSMTTALSEIERRLYQLMVYDRAILFARHPGIRAHARRHKAYTLKRITESLAGISDRHAEAAFYAREALSIGLTAKWAAYAGWLTLKALLR